MSRRRQAPLLLATAAILLALVAAGTRAEVTATHDAIIRFDSTIFPRSLPRHSSAPVGIRIEGHVKARKGRTPAALTSLELAINKAAGLTVSGLPVCDIKLIDPASSAQAAKVCGPAKIGHGKIRAVSQFPGSKGLRIEGHVLIFNGRLEDGRRAILIHVFSPALHTSFVFPLRIRHQAGRYHTVLAAHVRIDRWSSVTDFQLVLDRDYRHHGRRQSFLNASCPAPRGFTVGVSPFVVATLGFADGGKTRIPVIGSCRVSR